MAVNCTCQPPASGANYAACASVPPQPLTDMGTLQNIAASAGASSTNFTMCLTIAFLLTRRMIYYKASPGDCGSSAINLSGLGTTRGITAGLSAAGSADPEPISKTILSGLATLFGLFGAAHAQAVANEQTTLCQVSTSYNAIAVQLENFVASGQLDPVSAAGILSQAAAQLDGVLATVAKTPGDAASGFRIALKALVAYNTQIVFPALSPQVQAATPLPPSPGAPGTYPTPTGSPVSYTSAGVVPMNGNNFGVGPTSVAALPSNIDPGTIVIIAGVAYIASRMAA